MTTGATVEDHLRHTLDASPVASRVEQRHKQPFSLAPPELPVSLVLLFGPREETRTNADARSEDAESHFTDISGG